MQLIRHRKSSRGSRKTTNRPGRQVMARDIRWLAGLIIEPGNVATPELADKFQDWKDEMIRQAGQTVEGKARMDAIARLRDILVECMNPDWDGEDASPVTRQAWSEALRFLLLLPPSFPTPEVDPDSEGSIGLEWCRRRHLVYTVYFSGRQVMVYTGIFGSSDVTRHGSDPFIDAIPPEVLRNLRELYALE